jgi:phospholipase/carboxylesterase
MTETSIVVARPQGATQLVLLFHGVGSSAAHLAPVGQAIAQAHPDAVVVSVDAPHPSAFGSGRQWFPVEGITERNRPDRIAAVLPLFAQTVHHWQQETGLAPEATVLVGFSQGAILSLESTQAQPPVAAGGVIAVAGRFAQPPRRAPEALRFHLIHGEEDAVVPTRFSVEAQQELRALGGSVTLDLVPGLGHGIDSRALQLVLARLAAERP